MKRRKAEPLLNEIIRRCGDDLSRLTFDSMFAVSTFMKAREDWKAQVEVLKKFSAEHEQKTGKPVYRRMWSRLLANDARFYPPKLVAMNPHGGQDEELLLALEEHLAMQCNWLFVNAFEAYERYVKSVYAALGYLDKSFWTCSDYGDISADSIATLPQAWYGNHIRNRPLKFPPDTILKNIRRVCPALRKYEDGRLGVRMWVSIAAHFRHLIVHNHGLTPKDGIWERLTEATGYTFRGKSRDTAFRVFAIDKYLEPKPDGLSIRMIDKSGIERRGHGVDAPLRKMIEHIASHALLVYSSLAEHFGFLPFWEKEPQP